MRKSTHTVLKGKEGMTNKKMNSDVYQLRRKVIELIYSFKKSVDLPRIEVRITNNGTGKNEHTLGCGTMDKTTVIWIPERTVGMDAETLRHVVAHEIGHAVFKLKHNDNCPLMAPVLDAPATMEQIVKCFKKAKGGVG